MGHFRYSRLRVSAMIAASLLMVGAACSPDAASATLAELRQAVANSGSKMKNPVPWLRPGKTAASETDDLTSSLARAHGALTDESRRLPEVAAEIRRAEAVQAALLEVDDAALVAANIGASLASDATQSVSRSATVRSASDEKTMALLGEEILQDLICSVATDLMAPSEKSESDRHASGFTYMGDKSAAAIYKTLTGWAAGRLGAAFSRGFQWGAYGAALADDANRHLASIDGQIKSPDWQYTKAYIFVVRTCLAPPVR
jgi:hypothetical protein